MRYLQIVSAQFEVWVSVIHSPSCENISWILSIYYIVMVFKCLYWKSVWKIYVNFILILLLYELNHWRQCLIIQIKERHSIFTDKTQYNSLLLFNLEMCKVKSLIQHCELFNINMSIGQPYTGISIIICNRYHLITPNIPSQGIINSSQNYCLIIYKTVGILSKGFT